jgi:Sulfotransferase family
VTDPRAPMRWGAPPKLNRIPDPRSKREWASMYVSSLLAARGNPDLSELERFCFFVGYARSGHTLVATLLDAHSEMVIAHELDVARFVRHGFRRSQLVSLILQRDQQFGEIGRTWSGYQYEVPGQHQGSFKRLRVIGDKRARASALQIAARPRLLERIRQVVKVPITVVHVTRNPFDNIATEARRHKMSLSKATEWYEQICRAVSVVRPMLDASELVDLRYEDFATNTAPALTGLCRALGVGHDPAYLEACAGIVWPSTKRTRDAAEWSDDDRRGVERVIETYDVLGSYTFDD